VQCCVRVYVGASLLKDAYSQGFIINCLHFAAMHSTVCVCTRYVSAFSHAHTYPKGRYLAEIES